MINYRFFGSEAPQVLYAAGGKEMRHQTGGGHPNGKADKITRVVAVHVLHELLAGIAFHRSKFGLTKIIPSFRKRQYV